MDQFSNHPLYRRHNIDSAMSSLWGMYKNKFPSLFIISFAMSLVIQYASTFINLEEISTITDPMVMLGKMKELIGPILIISVINLLFTTILQYYIIYNPLKSENNIMVSALKSLKYFIPYLTIMVLLACAGSIVVMLGILVLIVGVFLSILYIMTIYLFILPVMMAEETNIFNTISRTISLVHRNLWSNIGWVAVFIIILIVVSVISTGITLLPFTGNFFKTILNPAESANILNMKNNPLFIILSAVSSALTLPLVPMFACILYFNGIAGEEQGQTISRLNTDNDRIRVEDLYAKPYSDDHPDNPEKR
jgi:hypothetical protein